ncbi:unnamed protein product [Mycena citricolor]|uniref:Amino acid permease/ SLC12A domain-containing protein n=1 Tax=Mycena citricolor TaxID=2018698 RepID=A0AAD2GWG6_9AGAR|nr:unnamed protein product [Mycena citricolor]
MSKTGHLDEEKVLPSAHKESRDVEEQQDIKVDVHTGLYDGVQRNMKQRHIQMIAIAGTLGTGLFLGSGKAIAHAGPAGALLAYIHVGTISYCMLMSLGEMICYMPISGGYIHLAERFVDPAVGFALGWVQWYGGVVSLPTEIISATLVIGFWDTPMPTAHLVALITLLSVFCAAINFLGVRWFGESEFIFAMIKIMLVVGCVVGGLVIDLGGGPHGDRIGFRYWEHPGAFAPYISTGNAGRFAGWFTTLLQAAYSYSGMENLAMTAAEVENPRRSLAQAVRRVFYRIMLFYVCGILVVGMLVPFNDLHLLQSTGTAADSPFVLAMTRAGVKVLPSIINAGVLTSAFSAGSSGLYGTSRKLYGMALRGQAPRIFATTTPGGLPMVSLAFSSVFLVLAYMAVNKGSSTALNWLTNLTTIRAFASWGIISWVYIRFHAGLKAQGIDRTRFVYWSRLQPWAAYWSLFWSIVIVVFNGFRVFVHGQWSTTDFIIAYVNLPIGAVLYIAYKLIRKTRMVDLEKMDFYSNVPPPDVDSNEAENGREGVIGGEFRGGCFE